MMEAEPEVADEKTCDARRAHMAKMLRVHWKEDWEPFSPEEFYVIWGALFQYAAHLLVCNLIGHTWYDSYFVLYGEPGGNRECQRCYRREVKRGDTES